jgi:hypothetical protein
MISSQTSRVAVRVAPASPPAAFSQIASILFLVVLGSVVIALAPRLHEATADVTAGDFAELVVGVVVAVELGELLLVELLLLLELPQPASKTAAASGTASQVERMRID